MSRLQYLKRAGKVCVPSLGDVRSDDPKSINLNVLICTIESIAVHRSINRLKDHGPVKAGERFIV